jgi:hypothetical protein
MKSFFRFCAICTFVALFYGCFSTPAPVEEKPPRREFVSVEDERITNEKIFIVDEYAGDGSSYSKGSVYFATALFLSDLGILQATTKNDFIKIAEVMFTNLPEEGELKELVIPSLSKTEEIDAEKNGYFFIYKTKNNAGESYYKIESNVPTASLWTRTYDGYVMRNNLPFYKNNVPAGWTSIMNMWTNHNTLIYRGVAYPKKSALLISTGTGIGPDPRMNAILATDKTIKDIQSQLENVVSVALKITEPANQDGRNDLRFLEKYTNMSLSAYSFIDSQFDESKKYFLAAQKINTEIPPDLKGNNYNELTAIMDYLINSIGK